jgi:hypothetical protein
MDNTWGAVFIRYKARGCDPSDAAFRADQWEKRQDNTRWARCPSTHCERAQECHTPNECGAEGRIARNRRAALEQEARR